MNQTRKSCGDAGELRSRLLDRIQKGTTDLEDIKDYGRLCGMTRRREDPAILPTSTLFRVRKGLEDNIMRAALAGPDRIFEGAVFGCSSKQGVSFRLGLNSCSPSAICKERCYAHDGRDAAPLAVQRGALNSALFHLLDGKHAAEHLERLRPHVRKAVLSAAKQAEEAWTHHGFRRPPRIRFAHTGDICKWPKAANRVGQLVQEVARELQLQDPRIRLVCYTRHPDPKLDPDLWIVNISQDYCTRTVATPEGNQNVTWAAFDGIMPLTAVFNEASTELRRSRQAESPEEAGYRGIDVVFVEHHGAWRDRLPAIAGRYFVCPSTQVGKPHGCDANRCDRCFRIRKERKKR